MKKKLCRFCNQLFLPGRNDQRFCNRKCRNHFNNKQYKNRTSFYKSFGDNLRQQDEILAFLINEKTIALIEQEHFLSAGIDVECARQLVIEDRKLVKAVFGQFQLIHQSNGYFKILPV